MKNKHFYIVSLIVIMAACAKPKGPLVSPNLDFTIGNNNANAPATVVFTNTSKFVNGFKWYFGDGDSSTLVNVSHVYKNAGNYTVILKGYTDEGIKIISKTVTVLNVVLPNANFTITMPKPFILTANGQFNNLSTNATSYKWDFGDRQYSTLTNPTHLYTSNGLMTVKLTAYNNNGDSSVFSRQILIKDKADSMLITKVRIVTTATLMFQMYPLDGSDDPDYLVAFGNWIDTSKKRTYTIWNSLAFPLDYNLQSKPIYLPVAIGSASPLINKVFILDHDITYEQSVDELDLIIADYTKVSNPYPDELDLSGSFLGETTLKLYVTWK